MTAPTAQELTAAVVALPGVRGIFPDHPISTVALTLVTGDRQHTTALIALTVTCTTATVRARLAIDRSTTTQQILRAVHAELTRRLSGRTLELTIEIAYID